MFIKKNLFDPNAVAETSGGVLAKLWRQFIRHPFTKGKDDGIYNNVHSRLQYVSEEYSNTSIPKWIYANTLQHKGLFGLLTIFLGCDKIYFSIELKHSDVIKDVLQVGKYTSHTIVYKDTFNKTVYKDKDNITNLIRVIDKDLGLTNNIQKLSESLDKLLRDRHKEFDKKELAKYKSDMKRNLKNKSLSWNSFMETMEYLLMVEMYRIVVTVEFTKLRISMTEEVIVGIGDWNDSKNKEDSGVSI